MGRTVRRDNTPSLRPVDKIKLSEKNIGLRVAWIVILLVIGGSSIAYAVNGFFNTEPGWQEIEADGSSKVNCSNEFVFLYDLGANGASATAENKAVTALYTETATNAYQLFHSRQAFENVNNVYYINQHPNEEIVVDRALYEAFSLIQRYNSRYLYLAPVYAQYDDIFTCNDDSQLVDFDPYLNEEVAAYYKEVAAFAKDPQAVNIQLLGNNTIMLYVSEKYLAYAQENYITEFIDFFWMKNAFIIDYLADTMIANGYTLGSISSYDGFSRNLDAGDTTYSFNIYDRIGQKVYSAATMQYSGAKSIVYLRNYMMNNMDTQHYYELANGEIRTSYLDVQDGFCKSATDNMISYSKDSGCAEIVLQVGPIYIADSFEEEKLAELADKGVSSIFCKDNKICYNDSELVLNNLYKDENVSYISAFVE